MARIRSIKPEFFRHAELFEAEKQSCLPLRVAYAGLWTAADREGRFKWEPRQLKLDCLPYDEIDFAKVLDALADAGFVIKYEIDGKTYGVIPSWHEHQHINQREAPSKIPDHTSASTCTHVTAHGEGKGKEGEDATPNGVHVSEETDLFRRGKEILGKNAGGVIANLLKSKKGAVPLARSAVEQAATKENPREYIARIISGPARSGPVLMASGDPYPEGIV